MAEDKKKAEKEKAKKKKKRQQEIERIAYPWDDHGFPSLEQRISAPNIAEAQMDPKQLASMRAAQQKKVKAAMGTDPAELKRRWTIQVSIAGIENNTNDDWEAFCAFSQADGREDRSKKNRLHNRFKFTKSYAVPAGSTRRFKKLEQVENKKWDGSYIGLKRQEIIIDLWLSSATNFNQLLGTARKTLYDIANDEVVQNFFVKPTDSAAAYNIGRIQVDAVVSEVFQFTIMASNWQFLPRPEFARLAMNTTAEKKIRIAMPTGPDEPSDTFETSTIKGPVYCWQKAGQFVYEGTKVGLGMEAMTISLYSGGSLQGKAVVSLGVVGVYPIAIGVVKAVSPNAENFVQGKVGGSLSMMTKSLLLDDNVHDEDPSIPRPHQPDTSLVVYHLSPKMQYLIVDVFACDGLPVADPDYGSSNAFVRVKFDNMVQQSAVVYASLSPTWNHRFYMPVRVTDEQLRTNPQYYQQLLPREMESKGYLEIQIWHFDAVPTEFLGEFKLDLNKTRYGKSAKRAACETATKLTVQDEQGGHQDDDIVVGVDPGLSKKHNTLVYEGRREKLTGSPLQSLQRASVSFDTFFIPDFPPDFKYLEQPAPPAEDPFQECYDKWDSAWANFLDAYVVWFPDSSGNRRFQRCFSPTAGEFNPLPKLIHPLALPATLANPITVCHWVRCVEFHTRPRQRSSGEIKDWQKPEDVLSLRRGTVQDHAVLLCCALLGLGKNAFVCKGTVQGGRDHAWVMTRESFNGTVTFWESTTGAKFHLSERWAGDHTRGDKTRKRIEERWKSRPARYDLLTPEGKKAWKKDTAKRQGMNRHELLKSMTDLTSLPISPWKQLYDSESLVVVPYESIEIVFNGSQVWGNLGNHHPACIYYDMEDDSRSWLPLISGDGEKELQVGKAVAIPVGPPMSKHTCQELEDSIEMEIEESVRMIRMRQGKDSSFTGNRKSADAGTMSEEADLLQDCLEKYVELLEAEMKLEADWCYDDGDRLRKPWGPTSPLNTQTYMQQCRVEWSKYWKKKDALKKARSYLPVKDNHVLSGIPFHISSTDLKVIRKDLMECRALQEYFSLDMEEAPFFTVVKVFPMPSSVLSVWIFFGAEVPMSKERVLELATAKVKKILDKDPDASSESEEDEKARRERKRKRKKGAWAKDEIKG